MKIANVFVYAFATLAFLTVGSLMIIVSLHVLSMEDALLKVQYVYENPWQSLQMGISGIFFIITGLICSKALVKYIRRDDDVVMYGKWGYMAVSLQAMDDLVQKIIRKYDVVKKLQSDIHVEGNKMKVIAKLTVISGWNLPELINTIQTELSKKLNKMLGGGVELELDVNVNKIIDSDSHIKLKETKEA